MIIGTFAMGDMVVTLVQWQTVAAPHKVVYRLEVAELGDNANDKRYTEFFDSENDACLAFAAIIAADDLSALTPALEKLHNSPTRPFLP